MTWQKPGFTCLSKTHLRQETFHNKVKGFPIFILVKKQFHTSWLIINNTMYCFYRTVLFTHVGFYYIFRQTGMKSNYFNSEFK